VDDILLIGNDIPMFQSIKTSLHNSFSMKDLGEATYILGIKIYRDRSKRLIGLKICTLTRCGNGLTWNNRKEGSYLCHMVCVLAISSVLHEMKSTNT